MAAGTAVTRATSEQGQAAQEAFAQGDHFFDVQQYAPALEKYRASYAIVSSPNTRLMIARCLCELGRLDEAFSEYMETLALAQKAGKDNPAYQETAQAAQDELKALRNRVGWLTVELGDVPRDATLTVAGKPVQVARLSEPLVVVPGKIEVRAITEDGREAQAEVQLAAGREITVRLKLGEGRQSANATKPATKTSAPPVPSSSGSPATLESAATASRSGSPLTTIAYVAGGVGIVGLAGFGVFGAMNNGKYADLESECPDLHCSPDQKRDIDSGRQLQTLANVSLIVGAVGLAAGVTLFYLGHRSKSSVAFELAPGLVRVGGRF